MCSSFMEMTVLIQLVMYCSDSFIIVAISPRKYGGRKNY